MRFKESWLAHKLLDGLDGIEIGGAAHSPFGLQTRNVDMTDRMDTVFKKYEIECCGEALPVDVVAPGDDLPFEDNSVDFVISSHVIEHFPDPIKALKEWHRVVRPGGFIYVIAPYKDRIFDKHRDRTTLAQLIERHTTGKCDIDPDKEHCSCWLTEDFVELINWLHWPIVAVQDVDDKVGNGFAVVIRVEKLASRVLRIGTKRRSAPPRTCIERRMSMNFIVAPTTAQRTAGSATMLEYAKRFHDRGHDVSITTWPKFLWHGPEPFPGLAFDVPIHYPPVEGGRGLPFHLLNQTPPDYLGELQFFHEYLGLITRSIPDADVLVSGHWDAVLPALQSGRGKVVHFASHFEDVRFTTAPRESGGLLSNPLLRMLCKSVFEMPIARIANSSSLARLIERQCGRVAPSVRPPVDTGLFRPIPKRSERDGIIRVVTYSRPEPWKGFADAMAAMQAILSRHARVQWHVHGFPPAIPANCPPAQYIFHGFLDHDRLSRLYAESDIVLCPGWCDSAPLPPLEAMSCGTAVITTSHGTEDYAINDYTALVTPPRAIAGFKEALERLIQRKDVRSRLARNGRSMAQSLSWEAAIECRENLLWQIVHGGSGGSSWSALDHALNQTTDNWREFPFRSDTQQATPLKSQPMAGDAAAFESSSLELLNTVR
jgi:glycosyltransferase involved in cell wall biosynthesis/SAM-dependent methyltransferase